MQTLKYQQPMAHGLAVRRFQQFGEAVLEDENWLEEHGLKGGNDGWFGKDTRDLAIEVQESLGLEADGVVGPKSWEAIFRRLEMDATGAKVYGRNGVEIIDGRGVWTPVKKWYGKMRSYTLSGRDRLRGVMLHQTGCWMPENPGAWAKINAHYGITRAGKIILMFDPLMLIWHGNGLTRPTIGIEIAGLFRGVEGRDNTHWPPSATPHEFNADQLKACDVLFNIIKEDFVAGGGSWDVVYAHRQSSNMRMSDPGEAVWKQVGLPWIRALGATCGQYGAHHVNTPGSDYCVGNGMPIPREWSPNHPHRFWG